LIAYFPLNIGTERMVIFTKTPASIARQTSLSTFQGQQFVFLLSLIIILAGILISGWILRRESRQRHRIEATLRRSEMAEAILKERNRLAGDLHDSVTQGLYGILLHADAAVRQISAGDSDRAVDYLQEIKDTGKEGLAEMRLLIFELRPPLLENEGLMSALEARLYAVEKRVGLETEITSNIVGRLPLEIEEVFYRIAQEALNNVLKHAEAKHVLISILQQDQRVSMVITEDGIGFSPSSLRKNIGIGFKNMEERTARIGGVFRVDSQPGKGTQVFMEVEQ
jgi:signal transduction histidine kinase